MSNSIWDAVKIKKKTININGGKCYFKFKWEYTEVENDLKESTVTFKYDKPIFKSSPCPPHSSFFLGCMFLFEIPHIFILIPLEHSLPSRELPRKDHLLPMENYSILKDFSYPVQSGHVDMASEMVCS